MGMLRILGIILVMLTLGMGYAENSHEYTHDDIIAIVRIFNIHGVLFKPFKIIRKYKVVERRSFRRE